MYNSLACAVILVASFASVHAQQSTCYRRTNDAIKPQLSSWIKCNNTAAQSGGAELCCLRGSECGEDSICRSDSTKTGQSRWYVGACTDPKYKDPICRSDCTQYKQTFITYNSNEWQCCGNSGCDEIPNGGDTFSAVSPSKWSPIAGNSKTSSSSDGGGDDLNLGEKIGIGVAIGIVVIALMFAGLLWFRRGTQQSRQIHHNVRGRYEEIGRQLGGTSATPSVPYGGRDSSPQPYGRSTSPIPPVRGMGAQRDRSRSIAMAERTPLPESSRTRSGSGLAAPDQLSMLSRADQD